MNNNKESSVRRDDNSLGILNTNSAKGGGKFFGNLSTDLLTNTNYSNGPVRRVSDRLNVERMKALETLQKSQNSEILKKSVPVINKENLNVGTNATSNNPSAQFDHTDYVPFRRPNTINISDLVTDETINLESSSSLPPSTTKDTKVSFEPSEMTGRSTSYDKDIPNQNQRNIPTKESNIECPYQSKHISVNDILASSFAPRARNLCETLQGDTSIDSSKDCVRGTSAVSSSSACSSFPNFNGSKSLPRTADMSLSKTTCTDESFNCGTFSFSFTGVGTGINESGDFAPGELMQSKLIRDEISWAQDYAYIPTTGLSKQAKAKVACNSDANTAGFDSSTTNSIIAGDPNFSVGNFFNMRSENIWNIVRTKSPDKCHTPVALVDEDDNTVTATDIEDSTEISITPKVDNKTYTRIQAPSIQIEPKTSTAERTSVASSNRESKPIENSTDTSYLLSMSAIDRALCTLDIQSDVSGIGVSKQILVQGKKTKSYVKPNLDVPSNNSNGKEIYSKANSFDANIKKSDGETLISTEAEMISENKENLDPDKLRSSSGVTLSDTISFNESLLNSSDLKHLHKSISQSRSPLSPIDVIAPNIRVHQFDEGAEADNDEWPVSHAIRNRRRYHSKSPRDKSPVSFNDVTQDSPDAKTPVNPRLSRSDAINKNKTVPQSTSLTSTRLDGRGTSSNKDCNFAISPDVSSGHNSASSLVIRGNTLTAPLQEEVISPPRSNNSPFSSPRSYNQSKVPSPSLTILGFQSSSLDTTNNSDRQKLSAAANKKVVSSPAGSEASSTYSYGTMRTYRSAMSGVCGRNVSRCSSSSEFSHRDGKPIPIKVTNTELSWGSIKLCSNSRKSMQIKNISDKRLVIRIEVCGPGFQIVNSERSNTVTLYSQECRSININFCPTVRGVAIGKLSFFAPSGTSAISQSFLDVSLYGYGGNATVLAQNICMAPMGLPFVTMGDVCELAQPLERTISFYNKGPLLGFVSISIDSIGLILPRLSDAFEIYPKTILIPPRHVADIRIVFRPKKEEIRKIIKKIESVSSLANMRVICGDEANRQRIRRLLLQMSEEDRAAFTSSSLDTLWTKFPNETEMKDFDDFKENPNVATDLLTFFRIHEILLTINRDTMDDTVEASSIFLPDVDDTVLFRTICTTYSPTPSSSLGTVDEHFEEEVNDDVRSIRITKHGSFSVSPKSIEFSLSKKENVTLTVINQCKSRQFFEVVCNLKDILDCSPSGGYLTSEGGRTEISIHLKNLNKPLDNVYVIVYMDNEKIEVPVRIKE